MQSRWWGRIKLSRLLPGGQHPSGEAASARLNLRDWHLIEAMFEEEVPNPTVHLCCLALQCRVLHRTWPSAENRRVTIKYVIRTLLLRNAHLELLAFQKILQFAPGHKCWVVLEFV